MIEEQSDSSEFVLKLIDMLEVPLKSFRTTAKSSSGVKI